MKKEHIHLIGICGTAMAAVAVMLKQQGVSVSGSDAGCYPPMSTFLEENDIEIFDSFNEENIKDDIDLVVVGNAISRGNVELEAVLEQKLRYTSLAELLKERFIRGNTSVVITGTHGKTTTTSLVAWLLQQAGLKPGYMIGGRAKNFAVSAVPAQPGGVFVIEGDEYDTVYFDKRSKFFHYLPDVLVINNLEFDHADIFSSIDDIKLAFRRLVNMVPRNGYILVNGDDKEALEVCEGALCPVATFGQGSGCDFRFDELAYEGDAMHGKMIHGKEELAFAMQLYGEVNARNALAAFAVARWLEVDNSVIEKALGSFEGVERRLESKWQSADFEVYEDFAHHPTAVKQALSTLKARHPGRRLICAFEPRSNTTVKKFFQQRLADALGHADVVALGELHRAEKIPPAERLDLEELTKQLEKAACTVFKANKNEDIVEWFMQALAPGDVVVFMSNGSFSGIVSRFVEAVSK